VHYNSFNFVSNLGRYFRAELETQGKKIITISVGYFCVACVLCVSDFVYEGLFDTALFSFDPAICSISQDLETADCTQ
jgi:hypothetical protein